MFQAALSKLNDNAPPTCAVLVSQDSSARENLAEVCESIGVVPVIACTARDAAATVHKFDAPLVIVFSDQLQTSPSALFEALRPSTPRLVMFGPRFGGVEHVLALELGFHEVWPEDVTPLALNALLRTSLRMPRVDGHAANESALGEFVIDAAGLTCFDGARPVTLSPSYLQTLALLIERSPAVVSREDLRALVPSMSGEVAVNSRVVDVHVSRIRRQLHDEGVTSVRIVQVRGRGYRAISAEPLN